MIPSPSVSNPLRVLHVEDDPVDAELVAVNLNEAWPGCHIVRAQSAAEVERAIDTEIFDIILSDFSMPRFDGMRALAIVHERRPQLPFIFVSGTIGEDNAVRALQQGATDYIIKDRLGRLVPAIRRALAEVQDRARARETEAKLRETQQRLQELAEHSPDVFWVLVPSPERFIYLSPAVERLRGLPSGTYLEERRRWDEAVHPDDRARVRAAYDACWSGQAGSLAEEYRIVRPDGTTRWVLDHGTLVRDHAGKVLHLSGILRDVTEQHLAAERIREQAEILNQAHDAIVVSNLEQEVIYWNEGAHRLLGWAAAETLGRPLSRFIKHPDRPAPARPEEPASDDWRGEHVLRRKDGAPVTVESHVMLIRDDAGRPKARLSISSDVTEKNQIREQLFRAQRLESIGMLAAGIAHDLNNVLAPILMAPAMLRIRTTNADDRKMLEIMERSAERGSALVRQILSFAHGVGGERRLLPVKHIVNDLSGFIERTFPKNIAFESTMGADLWPIQGSPTQIHQVLLNLCVNARDAMPRGGRMKLRAENVTLDAATAQTIEHAKPGAWLLLEVEDTGTGMAPEVLARIWDPFFTTKEADRGTGLGLSTVRGIVESHGGFVVVTTKVGQGTMFRVYLPASIGGDVGSYRSGNRAAPRGNGELILVVDDEANIRDVVTSALTEHGYRVVSAFDAAATISMIAGNTQPISAVIIDQNLPGIDGTILTTILRQLKPNLRLLATSGHAANEKVFQENRLPVDGFLAKPFTVEHLCSAVHRVLTETRPASPGR